MTRTIRANRGLFIALALLFSYFSLLGLTFNGILALVDLMPFTILCLASCFIVWRWQHLRNPRWQWYRNPYDLVLLLWFIAIGASIYMNQMTWRRSAEALWYLLLYSAVFYLLMDSLANRALNRRVLINALLFAGLVVMGFAYVQVYLELQHGTAFWQIRPVSLIGNTNAFAIYLLCLLPFALMDALNSKQRLGQISLSLYALSALTLIAMTQSRGAILATGGMFACLGITLLAEWNLLTPRALWQWQSKQKKGIRGVFWLTVLGGLIAIIGLLVILGVSLSAEGRSLDLRTYLWNAALEMFRQKPLTGQGLFTFGRHLALYDAIPPGQPQNHAHSLPLHIAAELGLVGLLALVASVIVLIVLIARNWRTLPIQERRYFAASTVALVAYGIHHLLDTPAMMPLIALLGVLVLSLTLAPAEAQIQTWAIIKWGQSLGLTILWCGLLALAFWHTNLYGFYVRGLQTALTTGEYRQVAESFDWLIQADPYQPVYPLQQAYLYGLAASEGDLDALERAIAGYERYTQLEPTHAQGWSNLAALYYQAGRRIEARSTIESAMQLAPAWEQFRQQRNLYAGILSDVPDSPPTESYSWRAGANWARFQYLREVIETEYLPQVGWGTGH